MLQNIPRFKYYAIYFQTQPHTYKNKIWMHRLHGRIESSKMHIAHDRTNTLFNFSYRRIVNFATRQASASFFHSYLCTSTPRVIGTWTESGRKVIGQWNDETLKSTRLNEEKVMHDDVLFCISFLNLRFCREQSAVSNGSSFTTRWDN